MPQKMPQKILPTKQPGAKSGRIELRRYNWFRRCAMLQKRCAMLHTPAEFQLKWSQILLRPNHPNLHLLKHIFYLFLFIYFFVRLSELANTQLDVALSRSSFFLIHHAMTYSFAYVCLGYVYLPIYPHHPTWHMLRALNFGHVMNVARAMWPASAVAGRRSASHLPATFRNTEVRFGRTDWIRLNMFDIVIIVIIVIIWYFFMVPPI